MSKELMKISQNGLNLIKHFEGLRLASYQDSVGVWTIGYGTTCYPDGRPVHKNEKCTVEQAGAYIAQDVAKFSNGVNKHVKVPLNQNQFDALVSFAYNLGLGNLYSSTLLKKLNAKDYAGAGKEFLRWDKAGGKVLAGLTLRRRSESNLFMQKESS